MGRAGAGFPYYTVRARRIISAQVPSGAPPLVAHNTEKEAAKSTGVSADKVTQAETVKRLGYGKKPGVAR